MELSLLHRRESIIISTVEILNEVGLQNLSTKLIAKQEGVSEGTLFRHFKNKTEIMLAVIDHFGKFDRAIMETSIQRNLNPEEAIQYFINAYAEYYQNYPAITVLMQCYDSLMCEPELAESVINIVKGRSETLTKVIKEGQKDGLIRQDVDGELLSDLMIGGFTQLCLKWRMSRFEFSLKEEAATMIQMLLDAFIVKK